MSSNIFTKSNIYIILLVVLNIIGTFIFQDHIFWLNYDLGRELYFPQIILENKVLYKDIFNFFGPFAYIFNACLFKLFGSNFITIKCLGYVTSILTITGIYSLGRIFFKESTSFIISLFVISIGITTTLNFNYTFPYSYSILYGFIAFIWSVFFAIQSTDKPNYIYISIFLAGIATACKYEFILYSLYLLICLLEHKSVPKQKIIFSLILFTLPLLICYLFLFNQGLSAQDFINSIVLIKKYISMPACRYFYTQIGTYFSLENLSMIIQSFIIVSLSICILIYTNNIFNKNKYTGVLMLILSAILIAITINYYTYTKILSFLPILTLILFLIKYKNLNKIELFLVISAILESIKILWRCELRYYGVFFAPILVIALIIMLKNNTKLIKAIKTFLIILSMFIIFSGINDLEIAFAPMNVKNSKIYSFIDQSYKLNAIIRYINNETKQNDKVVIYPENLFINYITNRKSENFYYGLNPAFLELFGEDNVINYYKNNKPEYFIIMYDDMMEVYGHKYICIDYAQEFCKFVKNNYKEVKKIKYLNSDKEPYYIYKRI